MKRKMLRTKWVYKVDKVYKVKQALKFSNPFENADR